MNILENIGMAFTSLKAGKMRSILTMLGIIIGIGAVIGIYTVGDALSNSVLGSLQSLGVNNIILSLQSKEEQNGAFQVNIGMNGMAQDVILESDLIKDDMLSMIKEMYANDIDSISVSEGFSRGQAKDGSKYANISLTGTNDGYALTNNITLLKGRYLSESDIQGSRSVAVVSDKLVAKLFNPNDDPLGQEVQLNLTNSITTVTIIGVYKYENLMPMGMMAGDDDITTEVYIPITGSTKITGRSVDGYEVVTLTASSNADIQSLVSDITFAFDRFYKNNQKYRVTAMSMESMLDQASQIIGTLNTAISVIAGISLLVGGIGVMNIMLVSVTERTREIGTRKALGAQDNAIRAQFIIESVILCLIGGIIGILLGLLLGSFGSKLLNSTATTNTGIIIIAVGFSMAIGIFFGYYPANKAAKLDPIEALRYE